MGKGAKSSVQVLPVPPESKVWLTPAQVGRVLGVSRISIYRACRQYGLKHASVSPRRGARLLIRRQWVDEWLDRQATANEAKR